MTCAWRPQQSHHGSNSVHPERRNGASGRVANQSKTQLDSYLSDILNILVS